MPVRYLVLAVAALLSGACARGPAVPWPPPPGEPVTEVRVYAGSYHSLIGLPGAPAGVEEWAFGERLWMVDERDEGAFGRRMLFYAIYDGLRALFWPNHGVIDVTRTNEPYDKRNPEERVRVWRIPMSAAGVARMRCYLEASIGSQQPLLVEGGDKYYPSARRYHVFHTCNHYVAQALSQGGVPIHPGWCLLPAGLSMQVKRLERRAQKAAATPAVTPGASAPLAKPAQP